MTSEMQKFFTAKNYDTLIENIPSLETNPFEIQSLCVAMPVTNIFGTRSEITNKHQRTQTDLQICNNPSLFSEPYINWEFDKIESRLSKLSTFPVTKDSLEYLARLEQFSQEYQKKTGNVALIFIENCFEPEVSMLPPDSHLKYTQVFYIGDDKPVKDEDRDIADTLIKRYDLSLIAHINYLNYATVTDFINSCNLFITENQNYASNTQNVLTTAELNIIHHLTKFVATRGLTSNTIELQKKAKQTLNTTSLNIDEKLNEMKAATYYYITSEQKQQRLIDKYILHKDKILSDGTEIVGMQTLEYKHLLPLIRSRIQ